MDVHKKIEEVVDKLDSGGKKVVSIADLYSELGFEMDYNTPKYVVVYSVWGEDGSHWRAKPFFNENQMDSWLDDVYYDSSVYVHQIIDLDRVKGA